MMSDSDNDSDDGHQEGRKRQREARPQVEDILYFARIIWRRKDPTKPLAASTEDCDFREFFGCSPVVALSLWNLLFTTGYLPAGATLERFLWALIFMKGYPKRKQMSVLCGGVDKDTVTKWVFKFIDAFSMLESYVVSTNNIMSSILLYHARLLLRFVSVFLWVDLLTSLFLASVAFSLPLT